MGRKKIFVWLVTVSLLFTAGCSKKAEKITKNSTEETLTESGVMEQFQEAENWKEDFSIEYDGKKKNIKIDAELNLPGQEEWQVVEGHVPDFDAEFKEKAANCLFGENEIDISDKEDSYKAKRDGIWCSLRFLKTGDDYKKDGIMELTGSLYFSADFKDAAPDELSNCDYVMINRESEIRVKNVENPCKYSYGEARKMAESFLKEMGFSDMGITEEYSLQWIGERISENDNGNSEKSQINGYRFGVNPVKEKKILYKDGKPGEFVNFHGEIDISDAGIVDLYFIKPFSIERISENAKLLSIGQIKEGIRQELKNNAGSYIDVNTWGEDLCYTSLSLLHLPVQDEKDFQRISFLPCWKLENNSSQDFAFIYVNAIDGSIIPEKSILRYR